MNEIDEAMHETEAQLQKRIEELEKSLIAIRRMAMGTSRRSYKDIINCTNEVLKKR